SVLHYSKFFLNTCAGTPYFQAHLPADYPLARVLQAAKAFRRLPANLRELSTKSRAWATRHGVAPDDIDEWYDATGNELDPEPGVSLTDAEIASAWPPDPWRDEFVIEDIPAPPDGFPDPNTWEAPVQKGAGGARHRPTLERFISDMESRGARRTAEEYG